MEHRYAFDVPARHAEGILSAVLQINPDFSGEVLIICRPWAESSPAEGESPLLEGARPGFPFWEEE